MHSLACARVAISGGRFWECARTLAGSRFYEPPTNGIVAAAAAAAAAAASSSDASIMQLEFVVVFDDANDDDERFELPEGESESAVLLFSASAAVGGARMTRPLKSALLCKLKRFLIV